MPVGIGLRGAGERRGPARLARFSGPRGYHPGALGLAAGVPLLATLLLIARLAG